jgi:hypothetical protein
MGSSRAYDRPEAATHDAAWCQWPTPHAFGGTMIIHDTPNLSGPMLADWVLQNGSLDTRAIHPRVSGT